MSSTVQTIACPPDVSRRTASKLLYPCISVTGAGTPLSKYTSVSRNSSRSEISDNISISFKGQDEFAILDPQAVSPTEFGLTTGYESVDGVSQKTELLLTGYPERRSQSLTPSGMITSAEILEKIQSLMFPKVNKIFIDVHKDTRASASAWNVGSPLSGRINSIQCSALVSRILGLAGSTIGLKYSGYDYKIQYYQNEDYPLNIIRDLVEFVGCYINYNSVRNTIEILDRYPPSSSFYDFFYTDDGDVIDLSSSSNMTEFVNAIIVEGVEPDEPAPLSTATTLTSPGFKYDDTLYLIDTISGKEAAPSSPFISDPPSDLIERKFFNTLLGFDIDPSTIKVVGGSWDDEKLEYTGAQLIGYGGMASASSVLSTSPSSPSSTAPNPIAPGEGKVGFPWNYEKNDPTGTFALEDGIYTAIDTLGKVTSQTSGHAIGGAQVTLDFANEDNIWQHWMHTSYNVVVRFYMPSGTVALGSMWTDVSANYPALDPPTGFPKVVVTASGTASSGVGGEGIFNFDQVPISEYVATGEAVGYDEEDLEIDYNTDDIWDFLKSSGSRTDKDYKLVDTPYHVAIYAKKAKPIIFGTAPGYTAPAIVATPTIIKIDLRHRRGISLAGGKLIYQKPGIKDPRIISEEIAKKAGLAVIMDSLLRRGSVSLKLPHNPWLKKGMRIAVQSYAKGWTGSSVKQFVVDSISTEYAVGSSTGIWDTVEGVETF